ncbi:ATP-binding protein [Streptomyces sp. TRM43335]|uniref:ATP-binding protein n=1 Tax=Streptomyces taklimakanensis TaxID=2569853 RepID=A0A6G2BE22_9ACTN|nr:ATP-binding protein [Streptomyces taklimakanensis]MTE20329.1 ATP-binding protein [Streptomyces taklimakanensis]
MNPTNSMDPATAARLREILAGRGLTTLPAPPSEPSADPDEPGHPEYHRRRRAETALARWEKITPRRYRTAEATDPAVIAWADAVIADPSGTRSLLLTGGTGTGKTHQAYGALRRIAAAGPERYTAVSVNAADMYGELRAAGGADDTEKRLRQLSTAPLLHIDDLGAAKGSAWVEEVTYRIVNTRYNDLLPTLITTNFADPEALGERLASRLSEMCRVVVFGGSDRRRPR